MNLRVSQIFIGLSAVVALIGAPPRVRAQANPDWSEPFPPFRIAGNLYYVGTKDLASYLVTTPSGHILINSDLEQTVPLIRASVEKLEFKFTDIKVLLISHAHWDHDAGSAAIKRLTGAAYMVMDSDVAVVESGGKNDFQYGKDSALLYPPARVDRVLHDADRVTLGGTTLVAHLTAGHTKGCTTWTLQVQEGGRAYDVVIIGSPNVNPGYELVNNSRYPQIAADYERTFRTLKDLPVDIFLGAHGSYFDLQGKYALWQKRGVQAFVDPVGYQKYVDERQRAFERTEKTEGPPAHLTSGAIGSGETSRSLLIDIAIEPPVGARVHANVASVGLGGDDPSIGEMDLLGRRFPGDSKYQKRGRGIVTRRARQGEAHCRQAPCFAEAQRVRNVN